MSKATAKWAFAAGLVLLAGGFAWVLGLRGTDRVVGDRGGVDAGAPTAVPEPLQRGAGELESRYRLAANDVARNEVLQSASALGTPEAVHWLADVAASDPSLGHRAGVALRGVRNRAAAPVLLDLAASSNAPHVRANAVRALASVGSRDYAEPIAALLRDETLPGRVRTEAAFALGQLGGPVAEAALIRTLEGTADDGTEQLRVAVIAGLGALRSPGAVAALRRHGGRELSPVERSYLRQALPGGERPE